jgi:hypothetical protein
MPFPPELLSCPRKPKVAIDAVIDQHGGWPGAFAVNTGEHA